MQIGYPQSLRKGQEESEGKRREAEGREGKEKGMGKRNEKRREGEEEKGKEEIRGERGEREERDKTMEKNRRVEKRRTGKRRNKNKTGEKLVNGMNYGRIKENVTMLLQLIRTAHRTLYELRKYISSCCKGVNTPVGHDNSIANLSITTIRLQTYILNLVVGACIWRIGS